MRVADIAAAISDAEADGLGKTPPNGVLSGLSGAVLTGALQRLATLFEGDETACYLEIGVFQGLTLLSVAYAAPGLACFGVDNFSLLDADGKNRDIVERRTQKLGVKNATLIDLDFEAALAGLRDHIGEHRIGVFFIDGSHDYRSQLISLMLAVPFLHPRAVIVIDDANYRHIRQANRDFLMTHPEFALVFEGYSGGHPDNISEAELARAQAGWWNGVNIIARDPEVEIVRAMPPVSQDRTAYFNDHFVHRHGLAELAWEAMSLADLMTRCDPEDATVEIAAFRQLAEAHRAAHPGRYADKNTHSAELPAARYHAGTMARTRGS